MKYKELYNEYNSQLSKKASYTKTLLGLKEGYISTKTIYGKKYFYLQRKVDGKIISEYIKESELLRFKSDLKRRDEIKVLIQSADEQLDKLEAAAKMLDNSLYHKIIILKRCSQMDALPIETRWKALEFGNAMTALEGIPASESTEKTLSQWSTGQHSFKDGFLQILIECKNSDNFEGDITKFTLPTVYAQKFTKFNISTICEIHRIIFDSLYEWAGEFRTIPIAKREDILGGDTVRYAYPAEIKKELEDTVKEISKLKKTENKKELVFKIVRIIAKLWQSHPFMDGNTRTIISFAILLAEHLGLEINHALFEKHAAYVRNSLVWAAQGMYSKFEYLENIFYDAAGINCCDAGIDTASQNDYIKIGDYNVADYKETPHVYLEEE